MTLNQEVPIVITDEARNALIALLRQQHGAKIQLTGARRIPPGLWEVKIKRETMTEMVRRKRLDESLSDLVLRTVKMLQRN